MRRTLIIIVGFFLLHQSSLAQTLKNDLEIAGLRGNVRNITAQTAKLSKDGRAVEGQPLLVSTASYDEQGNLKESTSFDYRGNIREKAVYGVVDGEKTSRNQYFRHDYDPPPMMAPPPVGEPKPRDPRYDRKFKYRQDGNQVERTTYFNDGGLSSRNVTTYAEGKPVKVEAYDKDGKLYFTSTAVYGEKGEELESTYYRDGAVSARHKYTDYEIDLRGNWISRKLWYGRDKTSEVQPYEVQSRTISYYDDAASTAMANRAAPAAAKPLVIRLSTGVLSERAKNKVKPVYPSEAAAAGIRGEVLVEVSLDEQGNVASVEGVSGDKLLINAVIAAVRQWKFDPTRIGGKPVRVIGRLRFNF